MKKSKTKLVEGTGTSIQQAARYTHEFYATPASAVRPLIRANVLPGGTWLEPCAGDGAIVRAAPGPLWWASDIRSETQEDLAKLVGPNNVLCPLDFRTDRFLDLLRELEPDARTST